MSGLDWLVLGAALALFVAYGVWRSRGERGLHDYLLAGRTLGWPMVAFSVMATQASAVTFLSTPGQAYADGMRFLQFYFGLPIAMGDACRDRADLSPARRLHRVQYLERRPLRSTEDARSRRCCS